MAGTHRTETRRNTGLTAEAKEDASLEIRAGRNSTTMINGKESNRTTRHTPR